MAPNTPSQPAAERGGMAEVKSEPDVESEGWVITGPIRPTDGEEAQPTSSAKSNSQENADPKPSAGPPDIYAQVPELPKKFDIPKYKKGATYKDIMSLDADIPTDVVKRAKEMASGAIKTPYRWPGERWIDLASRPRPFMPREWQGWDWYRANVKAIDEANAAESEDEEVGEQHEQRPNIVLGDKVNEAAQESYKTE